MRKMPKSFSSKEVTLLSAIFVLLMDQISKWMILNYLPVSQYVEVTSFFNIVSVRNRGVAFGLFSNIASTEVLMLLTSAVIIVFALICLKKAPTYYRLPISLIISGGIGNILDRIMHGAVVDFLDFHAFGYHWPAFNIADSAIVIGAAMIFVISLGEEH